MQDTLHNFYPTIFKGGRSFCILHFSGNPIAGGATELQDLISKLGKAGTHE